MAGDDDDDVQAAAERRRLDAEALAMLCVAAGDGGFVGRTPDWWGPQVFGGFVIGQAVHAATKLAPSGKRLHSLHAYFLRPTAGGAEVRYRAAVVRDGRRISTRQLTASQHGKDTLVVLCSYTADERGGYEYALPPAGGPVPVPADLPKVPGPPPWEEAPLGPTQPRPDGTRASTARSWFRVAAPLTDDADLHTALVGFLTDVTRTGGRPLHLEDGITGMVSVDHAVWFHRAPRADQWLLYDVHSVTNTAGRGLLRGTMHDLEGRAVASVAQEMLLTVI